MKRILVVCSLFLLVFMVACQPAAKSNTAVQGKLAERTVPQIAPEDPATIPLQADEDPTDTAVSLTHGPLSGEVSDTAVTLWARGNTTGTLAFSLIPVSVVYTPTVELTDTVSITDTVEMTDTVEVTGTVGITDTVAVTDTVGVTDTVEMTDTVEVTGTVGITDTVAVTDTVGVTDTVEMTDTVEVTDTVSITDTVEITDTVAVTDTVSITDTVEMTDTVAVTDTVSITDTVEMTDTVAVTDTVSITDTVEMTDTVAVTDTVSITATADLTATIPVSDLYDATTAVSPARDFTGQVRVEGLNPSTIYSYTVVLIGEDGTASEPRTGTFTTAPADDAPAPFSFVFGGCLGGQGYCRTEEGWVIFDQMASTEPDFFLLIGDGVYVDTACDAEGIIPGAEGPYTDLDGFRTRYKYHLEDAPYANFLANTPVYVSWDDHEVINDFSGPALQRINPRLFAEGFQAFSEYWPNNRPAEDPTQMYRAFSYGSQADFFVLDTRSYRDPNVDFDPSPTTITPKTMLGEAQFSWLQEQLATSEATWKFIVTSVPLSYPTGFPEPEVNGRDSWANFTEKSGYETELLSLVFYLEAQGIDNVVFLAGDTHWPYAISYDPDRNGEANFHEFASSPLSAITLPPAANTDPTLNPNVLFAEGEFAGDTFNFGRIALNETGDLTLNFFNLAGEQLYELTLSPEE